MQSEKPSLDVGRLLTGLRDHGKPPPRHLSQAPSALTLPAATYGAETGYPGPGASTRRPSSVRVGGIVVGHVTAEDYRRLQTHLAAGGQVDITIICS